MVRDFRERALEEARENRDSTKARILKVAEDLFAEKGFKGTTTREIAEVADVNIAMIHYHWGSKEELWNAVYSDLYERGLDFLRELASEYPRIETKEDVKALTEVLVNFLSENPNMSKLGYSPGPGGRREGGVFIEDLREQFFKEVWEYFDNNTTLDFEPAELSLAVICLLGALTIFFYRPELVQMHFGESIEPLSGESRQRVAAAISTMIERFGQVN